MRVLPRVQDTMCNSGSPQYPAQLFRSGDGSCPDENGPIPGPHFENTCNDCVPLGFRRGADPIAEIDPSRRPVRCHSNDGKPVNRPKLTAYFARRSRHAGESQITTKKPLIARPRNRIAFHCETAPFPGFDHLMQPLLPGTVRHDTAGVLIDDLNFAVPDEVIPLPLHEMLCAQRLSDEIFPN